MVTAQTPGLKAALKRGALIAAANWPLVLVQFVTESILKLLLAVPIVGGAFLVALLLDTSLSDLLRGDVRDIVTSTLAALTTSPVALAAFVASGLVIVVGGSLITFVVKGGTVALLAEAERVAGPIERPPLRLESLRRASVVAIDPFLGGGRAAVAPLCPDRPGPAADVRAHRRGVSGARVRRLRADRELGHPARLDRGDSRSPRAC